ncbi:hypothetical protein NQZ68_026377 [Dissostichus eleginoides]|nr:hypothetical protein NQZ68_026377 [Dissostichus eleginoides]
MSDSDLEDLLRSADELVEQKEFRDDLRSADDLLFKTVAVTFSSMETQTTARMRIAFLYGISEEFHRITSKDLLGTFGAAFDKHVPCLLKLVRKGAFGQKMEDLLEKLDEQDTDHEERLLRGVSVAILTVIEDDDTAISPNVQDVAVVLEGTIALHDLPDLSTAFAYLFGLLYAMNIDYPKEMRYTFEAIQTIFYELGSRCSQRRSRKTKLLL